jgi:nickel/cobalt exporter
MTITLALIAAAAGIGSVHTLAPDHWMPFAALARAERWSMRRTMIVTAGCGVGHVTGSVGLGLASVAFGTELLGRFGQRLESASGMLLIGFGVAYAVWGLSKKAHSHGHHHGPGGGHGHDRLTPWTLFLLFSADPCLAVIPLIFAAAPLGWMAMLAVIVVYEVATIGTMLLLTLPAYAAASATHCGWIDRHSQAIAGVIVVLVGIVVVGLGI